MSDGTKSMSLEEKLNHAFGDILKSTGYIFEILHNKKLQSNIIVGSTNQLITPNITAQLGGSIAKFEDILDDTVTKFNDARWCVEQIVDRQKQEEMKLKEEETKKRLAREEDERKRREAEEAEKREREEEEKQRIKKQKEEEQQKEELRRKEEAERASASIKEAKANANANMNSRANASGNHNNNHASSNADRNTNGGSSHNLDGAVNTNGQDKFNNDGQHNNVNFDNYMDSGLDFDLNDMPMDTSKDADIPNPSDILSTLNYGAGSIDNLDSLGLSLDDNKGKDANEGDKSNARDQEPYSNNILGTDELILNSLNIPFLNDGLEEPSNNNALQEEDFDVDSFLNQQWG